MKYVLNLCQGMESFLRLAILNKKIYKNPVLRDERGFCDITKINKKVNELMDTPISELLENKNRKKFRDADFYSLRKIFLLLFKDERNAKNEDSFKIIEETDINKLRNRVVHAEAYRPFIQDDIEKYENLGIALNKISRDLEIKNRISVLNKKITKS
jgi:hypothetical protein